jgi:hypothetical protein
VCDGECAQILEQNGFAGDPVCSMNEVGEVKEVEGRNRAPTPPVFSVRVANKGVREARFCDLEQGSGE